MLSCSQEWLLQHHNGDGPSNMKEKRASNVFPHGLAPNVVHVLIVTDESKFVFEEIIATWLMCTLVLEGLDYVGDLNYLALKGASVLCNSTALLLLILAC